MAYRHARLCFKAAAIEPLQPGEAFRVYADVGTFQMIRAEFYEHFPNVAASASYRQGGLYHCRALPAKALRFEID